ncbi:hypothetical protein D3C73_1230910 [compost metagenome]
MLVRNEIIVCSAVSQRMFGIWSGFNGNHAWVMNTAWVSTAITTLLSTNAST